MFPPSWMSLSPPIPSYPSRMSQRTGLSSLSHTTNSHWLSVFHMVVYMFPWYSLHSSHLLLPPQPHVHKSPLSHPWSDLRSHHQPAGQQARGHLLTTPAYSMKNTLCPGLWVDLFPFFPLSTPSCGRYSLTTVSGVPTTHLAFCKGLGKRWTRDSLPSWSLPILFTLRNSRLNSHATIYVKSFPCFK